MSGHDGIWDGRGRPFVDAAQDYVDRAAYSRARGRSDEGGVAHRIARAGDLRLRVMRKLVTADRYVLVFRFSHFLGLSRAVGVDPFDLCLDPPVTLTDAQRAFGEAIASGRIVGDTLRLPGVPHDIHLGAVPELCCLGYILSIVLTTTLLDLCELAEATRHQDYVSAVNKQLTQAIVALEETLGLADYEARMLHELVDVMRATCGGDFEPTALEDDLVLAVWVALAAQHGPLRFARLLEALASLTEEYVRWTEEKTAKGGPDLDDPALGDRMEAAPSDVSQDDEVAAALSMPLVEELLTNREGASARVQLVTLRGLRRLHLSRARAETFGPLDNKVIRAKRAHTDLAAPVCGAHHKPTHADTIAAFNDLIAKLARFSDVCGFLLWQQDQRLEAIRVAVAAGRLAHTDLPALVGDVAALSEDSERRVRAALDAAAPSGRLLAMLDAGKAAWTWLRRRNTFADFDRAPADEIESIAYTVSRVRHALMQLIVRIEAAVGARADGAGFVTDCETFCAALAAVHGFELVSTRGSQ